MYFGAKNVLYPEKMYDEETQPAKVYYQEGRVVFSKEGTEEKHMIV